MPITQTFDALGQTNIANYLLSNWRQYYTQQFKGNPHELLYYIDSDLKDYNMPRELSPSVKSVVTLLNNIRELLVLSNKRQDAKDVMRATEIYAKSNNIEMPTDKIEMFYARLLDSRAITLSALVSDIGHEIITAERAKSSKNKKNSDSTSKDDPSSV